MLKSVKSKIFVTALAIALALPCEVALAGVRAGGVSVSRPSISVARPAPSFTPPARVSAPTGSGVNNSGGSSFMKDVAASAVGSTVGSAVGTGLVNYAMKPSTPSVPSTGAVPAQQHQQQIPSLKPWEVIVDCNNLTYKALDICRGRSTQ
jgi:hypothetical protein